MRCYSLYDKGSYYRYMLEAYLQQDHAEYIRALTLYIKSRKRGERKSRSNRRIYPHIVRYLEQSAGDFLCLRTWILRLRGKIHWATCVDLRTTHQDRRIGVDLRGFGCGGAEVFSGKGEGKGVVLRGTEKARSTHKMRLSARFHEGRVRTAFIA